MNRAVSDASDKEDVSTQTGNVTNATVANLSPYTNYSLRVEAINDAGKGPPSDPVTFVTKQAGTTWILKYISAGATGWCHKPHSYWTVTES